MIKCFTTQPHMSDSPSSQSAPTVASRVVAVRATPIELCQLLKFSGLAESGGAAKQAINDGLVSVNGTVETRKRKQLVVGDQVAFAGETLVVKIDGRMPKRTTAR